ncbi:MAG: MlaA family lipoprotein [Saezia sp.]
MKRLSWVLITAVLGLLLGGCASVENRNPNDPFEPMNRAVFKFNDAVDRAVLKPVATGYKAVVPSFARQSVSNVFNNAGGIWSTLNAGFQLKGEKFLQGFFRVCTNTIFGIGGLFDVASALGLPDPQEDLGQTLGHWGVKPGPYLVLPFLGSSSPRDGLGLAVGVYVHPFTYIESDKAKYGLAGVGVINLRATLLDVEKAAESSILDRYIFMRDIYMQRRQNMVYDGNPPMDESFKFSDDEL